MDMENPITRSSCKFIIMEIEKIEIVKPEGLFDKWIQIIAMDMLIWVNKRNL